MKKILVFCFLFGFLLAACTGEMAQPTVSPQPTLEAGLTLPVERGTYFATSGVCATCHKNMLDGEGNDVSLDTYWRSTMMANSSRDPYWQASVRAEVIRNPDYDEIIQDKCTTCHTPMARTTDAFAGKSGLLLDDGFLDPDQDLHTLAMDGISCTLCHQIEDELLGEEDGFDGGYVIDPAIPTGERVNYGPYEVSEENVVLMRSASGFVPKQSNHIQTAEVCGTCHTLYTPTVDNEGEVAGIFPEQMPYIEWLASSYADQQTCQDCHMPEAPGEVILSVTGSPGRTNFSPHSFAGGNLYALNLLLVHGEEIGTTASREQIGAAINRAEKQLENQTAQVKIHQVDIDQSALRIDVEVESKVGHKFPSGFPSRRVWIHLVVQDVHGNVVFESGKWDEAGSIQGNDNDLDEGAYEPHYQVIDQPDQVQIYEAIMGDVDGAVTTTLLRGAVYLKDNRLLPAGFDKNSVDQDIAVVGTALEDADFEGNGDFIHYQVAADPASGPFTILVELCYQSIGYRWAMNLERFDAAEPDRFMTYYQDVPNLPFIVSSEMMTFGE